MWWKESLQMKLELEFYTDNSKTLKIYISWWTACPTVGHTERGVVILNTLRPWQTDVRIPTGVRYVSLLQNIQKGSRTWTVSYSLAIGVPSREWSGRSVRFNTYLYRERSLRMSGAIPPNSPLHFQRLYGVNLHLLDNGTHKGLSNLWGKKNWRDWRIAKDIPFLVC